MTTPTIDEDREMSLVVRDWLEQEGDLVLGRTQLIDRVFDQVDETKQRHRWWPLIPFGRRAVHSASARDRVNGGNDVARRLRGPQNRRRSPTMLSPVRVIATIAIVALGSTALLYTADQTPTLLPGGSSAESVLTSDTALLDRSLEGWNTNDRALLEGVYAPDATHTALFHDRVNRTEGADAIVGVAMSGGVMARIGELVPLPDTVLGERRYLSVMDFASGTPCVMWIKDDQVTRHDCIVPKAFSGLSFTIGEPPADVSAEDLGALSLLAWNEMDRAAFEQAYRPDVVHRAVFTNIETEYEGLDELWPLMGRTTIERSIPNLMLPAPEGELRWAGYNNVGSGSLCDFWVKDGQIARQDCIVQ